MNKFKRHLYDLMREYGYIVMDSKKPKHILFMCIAYDYYMTFYTVIKDMRKRHEKRTLKKSPIL